MFKFLNRQEVKKARIKNQTNRIYKKLKAQDLENFEIKDELNNQNQLISELKKYYLNGYYVKKAYDKEKLKNSLTIEENNKLTNQNPNFLAFVSSYISILLSFIAIAINVLNKESLVTSNIYIKVAEFAFAFVVFIAVSWILDDKIRVRNNIHLMSINIHISVIEEVLAEIEKEEKVTNKEIADKLDNLENEVKRIKEFNCIE